MLACIQHNGCAHQCTVACQQVRCTVCGVLTASLACPAGAFPPDEGALELVADLDGAVLCRSRPGNWSVLLPSALWDFTRGVALQTCMAGRASAWRQAHQVSADMAVVQERVLRLLCIKLLLHCGHRLIHLLYHGHLVLIHAASWHLCTTNSSAVASNTEAVLRVRPINLQKQVLMLTPTLP